MPRSIVLHSNRRLPASATGGMTSTVGEPSTANSGDQILMTGNWYAARSLDGGASWRHLDPFRLLPPVDNGFCCDQTTIYVPSHDITIWLLQYGKTAAGNTLRVAVKRGPTLGDDRWHWWDLRPERTNAQWQGEWFDYNHAAVGSQHLYVGSNVFSIDGDRFRRSVVLRLPLAALAAGGNLGYNYFQSTRNFTLRLTQGARDTMYFGSHQDLRTLRVFSWPQGSNSVSHVDVPVTQWSGSGGSPYSAVCPDGRNWLGRCDERVMTGWVAEGVIGFMWTANARGTARPRPHVRVVRIDEATKRLIDEPDIWHTTVAYAYPDASPNDSGDIGITLFRGGGSLYPGHVVGGWDPEAGRWVLQATRDGSHSPADGKWGDYVTCRRFAPDGRTWLAAGFTLQGGGDRRSVEPRLVHFGLRPAATTA